MQIWLIRHGVTAHNEAGRYQGALDTPLSPMGRAALQKAPHLPLRVYGSPLCRAVETAQILFPEAEYVPVSDLREMDFGVFEGRSHREMKHDPDYRAWVEGGCLGLCPGGEDWAAFSRRSCRAFQTLVDRALESGEKLLVIVAHGGTQMAVLNRWGGDDRPFHQWAVQPGSGYLLDTATWPQSLTVLKQTAFTKEAPNSDG